MDCQASYPIGQDYQLHYNTTQPFQTMVMLKNVDLMGHIDHFPKEELNRFPNFVFPTKTKQVSQRKAIFDTMIAQKTDLDIMICQFCKLAKKIYNGQEHAKDIDQFEKEVKEDHLSRLSAQQKGQLLMKANQFLTGQKNNKGLSTSISPTEIENYARSTLLGQCMLRWYTKQSFFSNLINNLLRSGKDEFELFYAQYVIQALEIIIKLRKNGMSKLTCFLKTKLDETQRKKLQSNVGNQIETLGFIFASTDKTVLNSNSGDTIIEIEVCDKPQNEKLLNRRYIESNQLNGKSHVLFNVLNTFKIKSFGEIEHDGQLFSYVKLVYEMTDKIISQSIEQHQLGANKHSLCQISVMISNKSYKQFQLMAKKMLPLLKNDQNHKSQLQLHLYQCYLQRQSSLTKEDSNWITAYEQKIKQNNKNIKTMRIQQVKFHIQCIKSFTKGKSKASYKQSKQLLTSSISEIGQYIKSITKCQPASTNNKQQELLISSIFQLKLLLIQLQIDLNPQQLLKTENSKKTQIWEQFQQLKRQAMTQSGKNSQYYEQIVRSEVAFLKKYEMEPQYVLSIVRELADSEALPDKQSPEVSEAQRLQINHVIQQYQQQCRHLLKSQQLQQAIQLYNQLINRLKAHNLEHKKNEVGLSVPFTEYVLTKITADNQISSALKMIQIIKKMGFNNQICRQVLGMQQQLREKVSEIEEMGIQGIRDILASISQSKLSSAKVYSECLEIQKDVADVLGKYSRFWITLELVLVNLEKMNGLYEKARTRCQILMDELENSEFEGDYKGQVKQELMDLQQK